MIRRHVIICGNVQGIFFRKFIKDNAQRLGVKGFARNKDGMVEAVFEGEDENVKELVSLCKQGPPGARIENMEIKDEEYKGEFEDFKIKYINF